MAVRFTFSFQVSKIFIYVEFYLIFKSGNLNLEGAPNHGAEGGAGMIVS